MVSVDELNGEWYKPQPYGFPTSFVSRDIRLIIDEVGEDEHGDVKIVYGSERQDVCGCNYWFSTRLVSNLRYSEGYCTARFNVFRLSADEKVRRHQDDEHRMFRDAIAINGTGEVAEWQNN